MIRALDRLRRWTGLREFEIQGVHFEDTRPQQGYLHFSAYWNVQAPKRVRAALMNAVLEGQRQGIREEASALAPFLRQVEQKIKQRLGKGYVVNVTHLVGKKSSLADQLNDRGLLHTRLKLKILIQKTGKILQQHKGLKQRGFKVVEPVEE